MENNKSLIFSTIEDRKEKELHIDINGPRPELCFYKIPKDLREINEKAYTPKVISIGPLHHGKKEFETMEKQKIIYKRQFSERITKEKWQELVNYLEENEQCIRNCYEDQMPEFEKIDFVTMILYDAIFIIELFLTSRSSTSVIDFLPSRVGICADLELLENQIPYFIVDGLYKLAFPNSDHSESYHSFFTLSCEFLCDSMFNGIPDEVEVKHFVDLRRYAITKTIPKPQPTESSKDAPWALKLQKSGVKFKVTKGKDLLDIKFDKKKLLGIIPWLKVRDDLQIPHIEVDDRTERLIRNMMALEQCHYPSETHVCNYVALIDGLINTKEDVNLLVEEGIISNHAGDTAKIARMFNELCLQISVSPSCYSDIVNGLNKHYDNCWNHAKATLKIVYFSNPWRGTGTIAAIVLLLLTLIQTIYSVL